MNTQTPGPAAHWPTHWAGGSSSVKIDGQNTVWIQTDSGELARVTPNGGRVTDETMKTAELLAAAYTIFDRAGRELGVDAVELAHSIDLVAIFRTAAIACGYPSKNAGVAQFLADNGRR